MQYRERRLQEAIVRMPKMIGAISVSEPSCIAKRESAALLVGGTFVVRDEALVEGVAPGRAIRGRP